MIGITTFSNTGYNQYARNMLQSAVENWPGKLIVYTESPIDFKHEKIEERDFFGIAGVQSFYQYLSTLPHARGLVNGGYNYNYDAWKFTRKIFAQYDVLRTANEPCFWLDADCVFKKPVPEEFLDGLFEGAALAFLGREGFYTETGFIGFNPKGPGYHEFLSAYILCLQKGKFFTLPRWHDCEIFDWARKQSGVVDKNLSPWFKIPDDKKMTLEQLDVVNRSVLGEYLDHLKGGRKRNAA